MCTHSTYYIIILRLEQRVSVSAQLASEKAKYCCCIFCYFFLLFFFFSINFALFLTRPLYCFA